MKLHPLLTAEIAAQKSILGALKYSLPYLVLLAAWSALGVLSVVLELDSALLKIGVVIGPLGMVLFAVPMLLQGVGDARRAGELEALLRTPDRIQKMAMDTTRRRNLLRSWLIVSSVDGASLQFMLRGNPGALWGELVREFPEATSGRPTTSTTAVAGAINAVVGATSAVVGATASPPPGKPPSRTSYRHPRDLVLVNAAEKTIEASIVIAGAGGKRFVRALLEATGASPGGPAQEGEIEHVVMTLGAIRGWTPRFFVYGLDSSLDVVFHVAPDLVASADAVVLVQATGEGARLEPALFPLAKIARAGKGALAFVGPKSALDELARDAAVHPDVVSHEGDRGAMLVLKEITKRVFARLPAG